jgi:hypothetical protein
VADYCYVVNVQWLDSFAIDWQLKPSLFDYGALLLTLLGLYLAWRQFAKAQNALQTEVATKSSLEYNQLLALAPLLRGCLNDIEGLIAQENNYAMQRELARFARACSDIASLAVRLRDADNSLISELRVCSSNVSSVKEILVTDVEATARESVTLCYNEMLSVTAKVDDLHTSLLFNTSSSLSRKVVK